MIVTLSGLPGAGTTTISKLLQDKTGFKFISAGEIFRQEAKNRNLSLEQFSKMSESDPSIDTGLDMKMIGIIRENQGNLILEGRLAAYNCIHAVNGFSSKNKALKVLLTAAPEVRAKRIAQRDAEESLDITVAKMFRREASERKRYSSFYDIDIENTAIYDIIIPTDAKAPKEIAEIICSLTDLRSKS
ncbi:MAG: cytidylate kinase family protein [Methanosarcinales archaeon]|jgi:predicted cytidylate kinase|nr:cytidylate kinase family protein [Methanosarcinales archaeon]